MNFKEVPVGDRTFECVKVRQCRLKVRLEEPVFYVLEFVKVLDALNVTQVAPGFVVPERVEHA